MPRGGRKDQPIDREAGPVAAFVDDLRRLRGESSLQEVGHRMGYHSSTVSRRLTPAELPPLDFVLAYVTACDADRDAWEERWRSLNGAGHDPQPEPPPPPTPRSRRPLIAAVIAVVVLGGAGVWWLSSRESAPARSAPALAAPAPAAPSVTAADGFPWTVRNMFKSLSSREWTQQGDGDLEIWVNISCPAGGVEYWIALRPGGETVRFECNSGQSYTWTDVPGGRYHFDLWKENNGLAVSGTGVVRSSTTIVQHPKPTPSVSGS